MRGFAIAALLGLASAVQLGVMEDDIIFDISFGDDNSNSTGGSSSSSSGSGSTSGGSSGSGTTAGTSNSNTTIVINTGSTDPINTGTAPTGMTFGTNNQSTGTNSDGSSQQVPAPSVTDISDLTDLAQVQKIGETSTGIPVVTTLDLGTLTGAAGLTSDGIDTNGDGITDFPFVFVAGADPSISCPNVVDDLTTQRDTLAPILDKLNEAVNCYIEPAVARVAEDIAAGIPTSTPILILTVAFARSELLLATEQQDFKVEKR